MVAIFKTDVLDKPAAKRMVLCLKKLFPGTKINSDLDDCDNILRIESSKPIDVHKVAFSLAERGHRADELD